MSDLSDRSGHLVESRQGFDSRVVSFYFFIGALLLILVAGLAYRQLIQTGAFHERERQQNQRRILLPGPRGNIYDRNGNLLVGNKSRFALVLYLDELQDEFNSEFRIIRKNYRETGDKDLPSYGQMEQIARMTVVQRYLDQVDSILGRQEQVDAVKLKRHFDVQLLLPYTLLDDLTQDEFARLIEGLPPTSPLQVYPSNMRFYPYGSAAAHTLGYVGTDENVEAENFPGQDLTTFRMKGAIGRDGLEKRFDAQLQGEAGGAIFRVNPDGYKVNPPLEKLLPRQGKSLVTSLDIDLQQVAEQEIVNQGGTGAAVALDVRTGEVLVLASKPDYDLNEWSPRLSQAARDDIEKRGAWQNLALNGLWPPGSTFKTVVTIAGLRHGLTPDFTATCDGSMQIGNRTFLCDNGDGDHGTIALREAIGESCDVFFWTWGLALGPGPIVEEARRLHLDRPTGVELPSETRHMLIPDPAWKEKERGEQWFQGDTANFSIGQGYVLVTPLQMACLAASLARDETVTVPTLIHDANRPRQHTEPLGLTPEQRAALLDGMEACTNTTYPSDTASLLATVPTYEVPGVRIAGKTGTAQVPGKLDIAWFICFAPRDNPEIAVAVAVASDTPNEGFGGGLHAAPIAAKILQKYFEKQKTQTEKVALPAGT
jgi:penicillin-binding protein 2